MAVDRGAGREPGLGIDGPRIDRVLEEPDRAVDEREVRAAGVEAGRRQHVGVASERLASPGKALSSSRFQGLIGIVCREDRVAVGRREPGVPEVEFGIAEGTGGAVQVSVCVLAEGDGGAGAVGDARQADGAQAPRIADGPVPPLTVAAQLGKPR